MGIAGEDDLDAPDLNAVTAGGAVTGRTPSSNDKGWSTTNPSQHAGNGRAPSGNGAGRRSALSNFKERPPVLAPENLARLRDALLADIAALSPQAAAPWAGQMLASKNRLTAEDARAVEQAFEARFAALDGDLVEGQPLVPSVPQPIASVHVDPQTSGAAKDPAAAHSRISGPMGPRRSPLQCRGRARSAKPSGNGTKSICS